MFDNTQIRGCKVRVIIAKYPKGGRRIPRSRELHGNRWIWKEKGISKEAVNDAANILKSENKEQKKCYLRTVKGEVNEEFQSWLSCSLVCSTEQPRDLATLSSAIISGYGQRIRICALSGFRFILNFPSRAAMEEALKNHEELDLWFYDIKRWDKYDRCESRKVWLEVLGIPPHGWKWQNFKKIAELWGYLICLGRSIVKTDTFETMTMLIETDILRRIEEEFIFNIEDLGFRVVVREISLAAQMVQKSHQFQFQQQPYEDAASNDGVPGFEDVEEGSDSDSGNVQTVHISEATPNHDAHHYLEQKTHGQMMKMTQAKLRSNSNSNNETEQSEGAAEGASINSASRTKTAMFSQNEGSDGVLNRMLASRSNMANESKGQSTEESMQEPPGFERRVVLAQDPSQFPEVNADNCLVTYNPNPEPIGLQENSCENHVPKVDNANVGDGKIPNCSKVIKAQKTQQCSSSSAEGSVQKIAKEVERIGNILGLTVVQNEKINANKVTRLKKTKKPVHRDRPPKRGTGTQQ